MEQGLCCLPGSALSLHRELPMTVWGERVGERNVPWKGRAGCCCCRERAACVRFAQSSSSALGISEGTFKKNVKAAFS